MASISVVRRSPEHVRITLFAACSIAVSALLGIGESTKHRQNKAETGPKQATIGRATIALKPQRAQMGPVAIVGGFARPPTPSDRTTL